MYNIFIDNKKNKQNLKLNNENKKNSDVDWINSFNYNGFLPVGYFI